MAVDSGLVLATLTDSSMDARWAAVMAPVRAAVSESATVTEKGPGAAAATGGAREAVTVSESGQGQADESVPRLATGWVPDSAEQLEPATAARKAAAYT